MTKQTFKATIFCSCCEDIFDVRVTELQLMKHHLVICPSCDNDSTTEFYERWDSSYEGRMDEMRLGDGND